MNACVSRTVKKADNRLSSSSWWWLYFFLTRFMTSNNLNIAVRRKRNRVLYLSLSLSLINDLFNFLFEIKYNNKVNVNLFKCPNTNCSMSIVDAGLFFVYYSRSFCIICVDLGSLLGTIFLSA